MLILHVANEHVEWPFVVDELLEYENFPNFFDVLAIVQLFQIRFLN